MNSMMKDLAPYPATHRIVAVRHDARQVHIAWDDGCESTFHALWLRDNCACDACRHPQTLERTFLLIDHPEPIEISAASVDIEGALQAVFAGSNVHQSRYDAGWLRQHCASDASRPERQAAPTLWAAAQLLELPTFHHPDIMQDDATLASWLRALLEVGVTLVDLMPNVPGTVPALAERVGPLRSTSFGAIFEVDSKPDPNNSAYTALGLELHTDIPNVPYPPSIQFLHCLRNEAQGGGSILVDGFRVAEELRRESPGDFRRLASEPIEFRFHDAQADLRHRAPVIGVDQGDRVTEVRFNNWIRGALDLAPDRVEAYYGALLHFWRLLREPRFQVRLRLEPGHAIVFDNRRVLHGREVFDPATGGRLLQGCYLDREWVESRLRLLARRG